MLLGNVEKELKKYEDPKSPSGYKPIPGVGIVGYKKPEAILNKEELAMRRAVEPLRHLITLSTAGLSQTQSEMQAVLTQDLGLGTGSSDESFIKAIPGLRARLETRKNSIASGFDRSRGHYQKRINASALLRRPHQLRPGRRASTEARRQAAMNVPAGTRARDPAPNKVLKVQWHGVGVGDALRDPAARGRASSGKWEILPPEEPPKSPVQQWKSSFDGCCRRQFQAALGAASGFGGTVAGGIADLGRTIMSGPEAGAETGAASAGAPPTSRRRRMRESAAGGRLSAGEVGGSEQLGRGAGCRAHRQPGVWRAGQCRRAIAAAGAWNAAPRCEGIGGVRACAPGR